MNTRKRLIIFLIWMAIIMIFVGIPGSYIPKPIGLLKLFSPDKIVHIFLFAPLAYLLLNYLISIKTTNIFSKHHIISTLFFGIIYAILTELLQFFVFIGRNGNIYDAIADITGLIIGIFVFNNRLKRIKSQMNNL